MLRVLRRCWNSSMHHRRLSPPPPPPSPPPSRPPIQISINDQLVDFSVVIDILLGEEGGEGVEEGGGGEFSSTALPFSAQFIWLPLFLLKPVVPFHSEMFSVASLFLSGLHYLGICK